MTPYRRNPGQERARRNLLTAGKRFCLIYGGSRSGKTFELVGTIIERALFAPNSRHLIVRQEATSAKRAIVKGTIPEVIAARFPGLIATWHEQYGYYSLPNGSEIWVGGLNDDAALEKILGNEYASIYMNEASECRYLAFTLLRSRLAQMVSTIKGETLSQRFYVDLNPTTRQHWTYRLWIEGVEPESQLPVDQSKYGHVVVNPFDNAANLSQEYLTDLRSLPPRARKRFMDGEYVEDVEEALWRRAAFRRVQKVPPLVRVVVSIDPAITNIAGSDETGIIAAGVDTFGNGYVIADDSGKYRPEDWSRRAIALFDLCEADRIVAEVNQGGDMVEHTIRAVRQNVPFRAVHATRSKLIRAEPIAALYERGKIFHVGEFSQLEDQMCLVAGTMIETARGEVPIENVVAGDVAMTRAGWRTIEIACESGKAYSLVDIETTDGRKITCTPNHPIFVKDRFVPASNVQVGDFLFARPKSGASARPSLGVAGGFTGWRSAISAMQRATFCIGQSGRRMLGRLAAAITFTMSTAIPATIGLKTSLPCRLPITTHSTSREAGTPSLSAGRSTAGHHGSSASGTPRFVRIAVSSFLRRGQARQGSVPPHADERRHRLQRSWRVGAPIVGVNTQHAIQGECIAVRGVTMRRTPPVSVYNLRVEGLPEYFANGILTHNCSFTTGFDRKAAGYSPDRVDALVWAMTDLFPQISASIKADEWEEPETAHGRAEATGY